MDTIIKYLLHEKITFFSNYTNRLMTCLMTSLTYWNQAMSQMTLGFTRYFKTILPQVKPAGTVSWCPHPLYC